MPKKNSDNNATVVAIIVPFRDPEREESAEAAATRSNKRRKKWTSDNIREFTSKSRTEQLLVFQEYMTEHFLPYVSAQAAAAKADAQAEAQAHAAELEFVLVVVEQSKDGKAFNRGKLLNVGFEVALQYRAAWCIFHDVDLLPTEDIWELYATYPAHPIHIGKMFARYNHNPEYFGGVVSMNELHFRATNGFPNTFFGWGGEDECQLFRLKTYGLYDSNHDLAMKFRTQPGSAKFLHDAEGLSTYDKKKKQLDEHDERSMLKFELKRRETKANLFLADGLTSLVFTIDKETTYDKSIVHVRPNIAQNLFAPYDCSSGQFRAEEPPSAETEAAAEPSQPPALAEEEKEYPESVEMTVLQGSEGVSSTTAATPPIAPQPAAPLSGFALPPVLPPPPSLSPSL